VADSEAGSSGRLFHGEERERESGVNSLCTEAESELLVLDRGGEDSEFNSPESACIADTSG